MTCQALETHQKGVQALHAAMNQVGQSQTARVKNSSDFYNNRLTADSSCMAKTGFEQSTDNFFQHADVHVANVVLCEYR